MSKKGTTAPNLSGLPNELVDNICSNLCNRDVAALHNVNSALYTATKYAYGERNFNNVHVMLTPMSFEKLKTIANDVVYASTLKNLAISTYVLREKSQRHHSLNTQAWDDEKELLFFEAKGAMTDVFKKCRNLATLVIADDSWGYSWITGHLNVKSIPAWGVRKMTHELPFKHCGPLITDYQDGYYSFGWFLRLKAFEAVLVGLSDGQLSGNVQVGISLEGRGPRSVLSTTRSLLHSLLIKVSHFSANFDSYTATYNDNCGLIGTVDPESIALDYGMKFWEAPSEFFSLNLGSYTHLSTVHLVSAKTNAEELVKFFKDNKKTLRVVHIKHIAVEWPQNTAYPWVKVFQTIAKIPGLEVLWPTNLVALNDQPISKTVDYWASQEVSWTAQPMIRRAIGLLLERYEGVPLEKIAKWMDLHYVQEEMMDRYGIVY